MLFGFLLSRAYMFKLGRKGILFPILCISWEKEPEAIPMAVPSSVGSREHHKGCETTSFFSALLELGSSRLSHFGELLAQPGLPLERLWELYGKDFCFYPVETLQLMENAPDQV